MKRLIVFSLLLFACAAAAAPPAASSSDETERAGSESAQARDEATRAGDEAARATAEAQKAAAMQARMSDLAQRMAELSAKIGDQASASALRYLADSKRGMLGVVLEEDSAGMRVSAVTPDGPAERAGIEVGDVITAIDGRKLRDGGDSVLAGDQTAGKPVALSVLRNGKPVQVRVVPERFQAADWQALARTAQTAAQRSLAEVNSPQFREQLDGTLADAMEQSAKARADMAAQWGKGFSLNGRWLAPWWGLNLASLNPELGGYFGTDKGALVLSNDAQRYPGLLAGDVITQVNGSVVSKPEDAMRALQARPTDKPVRLTVLRHGKPLAMDLKSPPGWDVMPPLPPEPPMAPRPPAAPTALPAPVAPAAPPAPASVATPKTPAALSAPPVMPVTNARAGQSPDQGDANALTRFKRHATPPQRSMHYFHLDSFQYLGRDPTGKDAIAIWTGVNQVYLLTLDKPCINLDLALAIGLTSTLGDVNAGMDYVKYNRNGPRQCRIMTIQKVDYKAMKAEKK